MQDWSYINRCSRCGAGNPRDSELCIRCGLPMRQMRPEDERGDESLEADAVAVRGNLDSASKCAMMFEAEIRVTRFPIYLCTSVLFAALSILLIAGVVAWSGSQMLGFADLRDKIDTPVYPVREAARDVSGLGMLFFAALWFLAPATASLIAIAGSGAVLDFQQPRWRIGFRLFTLALVLAALWPLMPWIVRYSNVDGEIIQSRVDVFRFIHIGANLLVGLMLAFASRDESQPDTTMSGNAGSTGT